MKNKTAIEWMAQAFITNSEVTGINNDEWIINERDLDRIVEQAKQMEREQIEQAFNNGMNNSEDYFDPAIDNSTRMPEAQTYYNETYN